MSARWLQRFESSQWPVENVRLHTEIQATALSHSISYVRRRLQRRPGKFISEVMLEDVAPAKKRSNFSD